MNKYRNRLSNTRSVDMGNIGIDCQTPVETSMGLME
jgi:hypothetical protein